ncbi:MAG: flavin reductase family protein [Cyanothece sp. SIO1E1]|nr:flavin reductase family protein [Cyanothece sp. SIO1E1]
MSDIKSFDPYDLTIPERQGILTAAIGPRPICFASTVDKNGNVNLSPYSFFNVFSNNPPILIFSPSRRGRDGTNKHTYYNIKEVPEVCVNIVNYPMVEQMSLASTEYERGVNEFVKAGFTEVPSEIIQPPRVKESPVSFECTVDQVIELGDEGGAGNLILARIQRIHLNTGFLNEEGKLDNTRLDLVGRMGANWYTRANTESLFEIPKPLQTKGIGVDQLPEHVRKSDLLTANNLGRLGNVEQLPSLDQIKDAKEFKTVAAAFTQFENDDLKREIHRLAKIELELGNATKALTILCTFHA